MALEAGEESRGSTYVGVLLGGDATPEWIACAVGGLTSLPAAKPGTSRHLQNRIAGEFHRIAKAHWEETLIIMNRSVAIKSPHSRRDDAPLFGERNAPGHLG